jgi:hypothetical protein
MNRRPFQFRLRHLFILTWYAIVFAVGLRGPANWGVVIGLIVVPILYALLVPAENEADRQ